MSSQQQMSNLLFSISMIRDQSILIDENIANELNKILEKNSPKAEAKEIDTKSKDIDSDFSRRPEIKWPQKVNGAWPSAMYHALVFAAPYYSNQEIADQIGIGKEQASNLKNKALWLKKKKRWPFDTQD